METCEVSRLHNTQLRSFLLEVSLLCKSHPTLAQSFPIASMTVSEQLKNRANFTSTLPANVSKIPITILWLTNTTLGTHKPLNQSSYFKEWETCPTLRKAENPEGLLKKLTFGAWFPAQENTPFNSQFRNGFPDPHAAPAPAVEPPKTCSHPSIFSKLRGKPSTKNFPCPHIRIGDWCVKCCESS